MKTKTISGWLLAASLAGLLPLLSGACLAQTPSAARPAPAPRAAPRPDDINPGVDTSADIHPRDNTPGSSAAQASQAAEEALAASPAPSGKASKGSKAGKPDKVGGKADPAKGTGKAQDHLELDRTQITGNRELPKVMVIVPWKRSDLGDLGKPMNSLVNEVLQPIDRDVFQRQTRYYDALKPDAAGNAAPAAAPGSGR